MFNEEILFAFDEGSREILLISANPSAVEVGGATLAIDRDSLIALLGNPADEGWTDGEMEDSYYYMQSYFTNYSIAFALPDQNSVINGLAVQPL